MAESIAESGGFTQDLFSPLQFCEVVEEGQQHQHRQLQQLHRHQPLNQQLNAAVQQASQPPLPHQQQTHEQALQQQQQSHIHQQQQQQQQQQQNQSQTQQQHQQSIQQPSQQTQHHVVHQQQSPPQLIQNQSVKQETSQANQALHDNQDGSKTPGIISSMEIFLAPTATNGLSVQPVNIPVVALQQPQIGQHLYQVQLNRQQPLPQLQLNPQMPASTQGIQLDQQLQQTISEAAVVGISGIEGFTIPISATPVSHPTTSTVATQSTQSTQTESQAVEDDEPEVIFSSAKKAPLSCSTSPKFTTFRAAVPKKVESLTNGPSQVPEVKPVPVKKTWRRPWKKKKEREKRPPVKKARRVKRKRVVMPKRNSVHIDPRHGPPIDTSRNVVQRESEDNINQLKQKRQRIKLNRNSGREYINRLGKIVCARKIGSPCNCPLKCWDRMGSRVLDIFNNFWDLCDFNLQNSYLFTCLKLCDVKRRYTKKQPAEESRRQNTFEYFVRISGKHFRVCKKAFMSSHGLTSDKRLRTLFTQMKDGALIPEPDRRGKHLRPNKPSGVGGLGSHNSHLSGGHLPKATKKPSFKTKKKSHHQRVEASKQAMYTPPPPPPHAISHIHPPPPPAHGTAMQEPPHAYIPNGDIYFPGHYLEPPQAMAPPHMNQIPSCQKMLETPAYFMAGMKENTFHQ